MKTTKKILEDNLPKEEIQEWGGTIEKLMKEYALHISEQAINEVRDDHVAAISIVVKEKSYEFSKIVNKVSDDALLKIKDLLKEAT